MSLSYIRATDESWRPLRFQGAAEVVAGGGERNDKFGNVAEEAAGGEFGNNGGKEKPGNGGQGSGGNDGSSGGKGGKNISLRWAASTPTSIDEKVKATIRDKMKKLLLEAINGEKRMDFSGWDVKSISGFWFL